jgi:PAS domain S-box-containing protein
MRRKTIDDHNRRQQMLVEQSAFAIENFFKNIEQELILLATIDDIAVMNKNGKQIFEDYILLHDVQIKAITRMDANGSIVFTAPFKPEAIGVSIAGQTHVAELLETHEMVTSDVFRSIQGYDAIAIHVPVFTNGKFAGSLATLIPFDIIIRDFVKGTGIEKANYPLVLSAGGLELYCPIDQHKIDSLSVQPAESDNDCSFGNDSLTRYCRQMLQQELGTGSYDFSIIVNDEPREERMHASHHRVRVGTTFWSISVATPEIAILASLTGFRTKLAIVLSMTLLVFLLFSILASRTWLFLRVQKIRAHSQEEIRISEAKYRNIVEAIQDVYFRMDLDGVIQMMSPSGAILLGFDGIDQLIGTSFADEVLLDPSTYTRLTSQLDSAGAVQELELALRHDCNANVIASINCQFVYDEDGNRTAIEGILRDVTHRKMAEMELERSRTLALEARDDYEQVVSMIPEIVWRYEIDSAGGFKRSYISPVGDRMLGLVEGTLNHDLEKFLSMVHPDDQSRVRSAVFTSLSGLIKNSAVEYRLIAADGSELWLRSTGSAYAVDGGGAVIVGTTTNVTDIKASEMELNILEDQLRQTMKLEAIGNLAGGIAHDFNNILHSIIGNAELAREQMPADSFALECIEEVTLAGKRASELVNQILTFARKDQKQRKIVDVDQVVRETLKLLRPTTPASITIVSQVMTENTHILADPIEVHQILMNLCSNAIQEMTLGGGTLEIMLADSTQTGIQSGVPDLGTDDLIVLSVQDTGAGIQDNVLGRIFEPFFTTKEAGKGTGMGLSVVHGIVRGLGGAITVDTAPGMGSTFYVWLPHCQAEKPSSVNGVTSLPRGSETIMLVDDEPAIIRILEKYLHALGYKTQAFSNGRAALDAYLIKPDCFDLIVTDQTMPNMTGDVLIKGIRSIDPKQRIILCTGFSEVFPLSEARKIGVNKYLRKPFSQSELAESVRSLLDMREPVSG